MLLSTFSCQKAKAATADGAFNACLQVLDQSPDALRTDTWRNTPLDSKVTQLVEPLLYGSIVIRWISYKNDNGSTTIVVLIRDPGPQPGDDPDSFFVIFKQKDHLSLKDEVGANAFSFSKKSHDGVSGLLFCTQDEASDI